MAGGGRRDRALHRCCYRSSLPFERFAHSPCWGHRAPPDLRSQLRPDLRSSCHPLVSSLPAVRRHSCAGRWARLETLSLVGRTARGALLALLTGWRPWRRDISVQSGDMAKLTGLGLWKTLGDELLRGRQAHTSELLDERRVSFDSQHTTSQSSKPHHPRYRSLIDNRTTGRHSSSEGEQVDVT